MKYLFYRCPSCGNFMVVGENDNAPMCCGQEMTLLTANVGEGVGEKHIPVVSVEGNKVVVKVGEVAHPMLNEHYIECIILVTDKNVYTERLMPNTAPEATFVISANEKVINAYEYCNLHGFYHN